MRSQAKSMAACTTRRPKRHSLPAARCWVACGRRHIPERRANGALGFAGPQLAYASGTAAQASAYPVKAPPYGPSRDLTFWSLGLGGWGHSDGDGNAASLRAALVASSPVSMRASAKAGARALPQDMCAPICMPMTGRAAPASTACSLVPIHRKARRLQRARRRLIFV